MLDSTEQADPKNLGSYFSLINEDQVNNETVQTSSINLNRMEGHLGVKGKVVVSADTVTLDNQVKFNYKNDIAQPFKQTLQCLPMAICRKSHLSCLQVEPCAAHWALRHAKG